MRCTAAQESSGGGRCRSLPLAWKPGVLNPGSNLFEHLVTVLIDGQLLDVRRPGRSRLCLFQKTLLSRSWKTSDVLEPWDGALRGLGLGDRGRRPDVAEIQGRFRDTQH